MTKKKLVAAKKTTKRIKLVKKPNMRLRQEKFCQLYATDMSMMGNGTDCYLEAYEVDRSKPNWIKTAAAAASRLLKSVKVYTRINELLEENGLNDQFVDKQLLFLISQQADLSNKNIAIREYNKLKSRITEKVDLNLKARVVTKFDYKPPTEDGNSGNKSNNQTVV